MTRCGIKNPLLSLSDNFRTLLLLAPLMLVTCSTERLLPLARASGRSFPVENSEGSRCLSRSSCHKERQC
jgi:hypothetical protein